MEYPRTAAEFNRRFSTEEARWDYLVKLRWPEGFRCPDCGSHKAWLTSNKLFRCGACESAVSVTAGTICRKNRRLLQDR
jgi:ribosomal protein L37AE/L43A